MNRYLLTLAALVALSASAWGQELTCVEPSDRDTDGDGFSDFQECSGLPLVDGTTFVGALSGLPRAERLDPDAKDLFVIYRRARATLLEGLPDPFRPGLVFNNTVFNGLADLGVTVHVLFDDANNFLDRAVSQFSAQKAVRITENLDTAGTILGNCQWGTPQSLDGCIVYTQRAKNFIEKTCPGDPRNAEVFLAYANFLILHETGHSLGGLAAAYNSRFGGYHYKAGAGVIMEQAVTYSVKRNTCTWYIPSRWNATLDPPAVRLNDGASQ